MLYFILLFRVDRDISHFVGTRFLGIYDKRLTGGKYEDENIPLKQAGVSQCDQAAVLLLWLLLTLRACAFILL